MAVPAPSSADERTHQLGVRMAAWHRTIVAVREESGNAGVSSYHSRGAHHTRMNYLAKLQVGVLGEDRAAAWFRDGEGHSVEDFPGGVTTSFRARGTEVTAHLVALMEGRGVEPWEGAAAYVVSSSPGAPLVVRAGGESSGGWYHGVHGAAQDLAVDEPRPLRDLQVDGALLVSRASEEDLFVAMRATAPWEPVAVEGGEAARVALQDGEGAVVVGWASTRERAVELASLDAAAGLAAVREHYDELLASRIETPEPDMDAAFRSAIYNLEYNWIGPYGWNECIHHWLSFWHNQHTAAAEWLGQEERSREVTLFHAENLLASGAAPQFFTTGLPKREFGGSNQFFSWQAWHYWLFTGDKEFAAVLGPALDRVIRQTLEEHDPDGNLLIGWGPQIGNQEDFIEFPSDGGTPSIELVNMMRARGMLARAVGDEATAEEWDARVERSLSALRRELWLPDLGRLANFRDESGKPRLEAQYHTLLYPALWGIVDELDAHTSLRHVHDTLTGPDGMVYVSNLFPNHFSGTWGMQGGAAQQPWAAWAFAKAGQGEKVFQPLRAIAAQVMDENKRGAWPEVSYEHVGAYFTPPAGLYIASVTEALFGLFVNKPEGVLEVAPSFPESWPSARIELPKFRAEFERGEGFVRYTVESDEPLARRVSWSLPPSRVDAVLVDGEPAFTTLMPGVNRVVVGTITPPATRTVIEIRSTPLGARVVHAGSVAEGELLDVRVEGARPVAVDDRLGMLGEVRVEGDRVSVRVREGLLAPYAAYGRLGAATFSRRTFFVRCEAEEMEFWLPVDVMVLPPVEAAAPREVVLEGEALVARVVLRNNGGAMSGDATLHVAGDAFTWPVALAARSEQEVAFRLPPGMAGVLSPGDNTARVVFPGGASIDIVLSVTEPFREGVLRAFAEARLQPVALPREDTVDASEWARFRPTSHGGPVPWPHWVQPLQGMEGVGVLEATDIPGLRFEFEPSRWIMLGERGGRPFHRMELPEGMTRKLHLLVAVFCDNHDMYSRLGTVIVRDGHRVVASRDLHMPGDVDWWEPNGMLQTMDILREGRDDRLGLAPLVGGEDGTLNEATGGHDWSPPVFPRPPHWSRARFIKTPNCNFNIIEVDLGEARDARSVSIQMDGISPAMALVAVTAEMDRGHELLEGTPFVPPARHRRPTTLFSFRDGEALEGWTLEGEAFSVSSPWEVTSLNSVAKAGETATGVATSPPFAVEEGQSALVVMLQGGAPVEVDGVPNLRAELVDAARGERLGLATPPATHVPQEARIDLRGLAGRTVLLRLVDENTGAAYAWIGLAGAQLAWGED